jgi:hypothetical protein
MRIAFFGSVLRTLTRTDISVLSIRPEAATLACRISE